MAFIKKDAIFRHRDKIRLAENIPNSFTIDRTKVDFLP